MTELKPCPFCGGEAELVLKDVDSLRIGMIRCKSCGADGAMKGLRASEISARGASIIADAAADAWNRRVEK